MDALSLAATFIALVSTSIQLFVRKDEIARNNLKEFCRDLVNEGLLRLCFPSVRRVWRLIDDIVLPGDEATVEKFRLSYTSDCNITAVGVCCCLELSGTF